MNTSFKVIIPCYNAEKWIEKCINSLTSQTYKNWKAMIVNDGCTDNTENIIRETLGVSNLKIKTLHFKNNRCPLASIHNGTGLIEMRDPDSVIVILDGDDWLYNEHVLEYLNEIYQDPNIWLTYGDYVHASNPDIPSTNTHLTSTRRYRKWRRWRTSHLRTYKNKLWLKVKLEDLKNSDGDFYPMSGDMATMFPMVEMAGLKHIKYIQKPLYVYNDTNPLNEHVIDRNLQKSIEDEIRAKDVYDELTELDSTRST